MAPAAHYDPGWAGLNCMLAPEGSDAYEKAWHATRKGVTLIIPSHHQLLGFQSQAKKELAAQYFRTWYGREENYLWESGTTPEECVLKENASKKQRTKFPWP